MSPAIDLRSAGPPQPSSILAAPERLPFAVLYAGAEQRLRDYAHYVTRGSEQDGDDLLQDAALRMYTKYEQFAPGTNFLGWANRIIHNLRIGFHRRRTRRHRLREDTPPGVTWISPEDSIGEADAALDRQRALALCARLSPLLREAFELRYRDYSYAEIAERLGVPVATAKSRVFHARRRLRAYLADYYR